MNDPQWFQLPRDAGQIVDRRWVPTRIGAILRTHDRADGRVEYTLHRWTGSVAFDPVNGLVCVEKRGTSLTEGEVRQLLDD
jgi:hypothetical protein